MSLSSITVSGTLRKDPEKRFTPTNIPVTNMLLEITFIPRGSQNGQLKEPISQFVRVNAWRDLAEECERSLKTGDKIFVVGRAQINAYTNNEGKKKRDLEIDAVSITLLKNVLDIKMPQKAEEPETVSKDVARNVSIHKKVTQNVEPISNFEEVVSSTEEIPF